MFTLVSRTAALAAADRRPSPGARGRRNDQGQPQKEDPDQETGPAPAGFHRLVDEGVDQQKGRHLRQHTEHQSDASGATVATPEAEAGRHPDSECQRTSKVVIYRHAEKTLNTADHSSW